MSADLKPCPLCGSRAVLTSGWDGDDGAKAVVSCTRRGISDACCSVYVERSDLKTAERDAAGMWNRRAEE